MWPDRDVEIAYIAQVGLNDEVTKLLIYISNIQLAHRLLEDVCKVVLHDRFLKQGVVMNKFLKCAVAAAAVVGSVQVHADLVIDTFKVGAQDVSSFGGVAYSSSGVFTNADILGTQRDIIIERTITPDSGSRVRAAVDTTNERFTFSQDVGTAGYATLRYDGAGTVATDAINTAGLGSICVSCSAGGFSFKFGSDSNYPFAGDPFDITIEVWGAGGAAFNSFTETVPGTGGASNLVNGFVLLTEAAWTNAGFDWSDVSAMQITFNTGTPRAVEVDFAFTAPIGIPEPAGLALAGLALLGAGVARRTRKSA
jgi:hypothetical protein